MNKKILFFDIDGTILTADHMIPQSAREALLAVQQAGHVLVINTGRPYRHIEPQIRSFGFNGYVCAIGGHIFIDGREILYKSFTHDESAEIRNVGYECGMDMLFESERGIWMDDRCTSAFARREFAWLESIGVPGYTDTEREDFSFDKFVCWPTEHADRERFINRFSDRLNFIYRENSMLEVVHKGLSKAKGMRIVMEALGFSAADSYAFGDGANDLPMLREAGTSVLMGNAPKDLWKEADYVTSSVTDDGLAKALRHFELM